MCSNTIDAPWPAVASSTRSTRSGAWWCSTRSARLCRRTSSFSSLPALVMTRAPASFAISIAALPRPLVPAHTKTVSAADTAALPTSICHAVMYVFGKAATCSSGTEGSTIAAKRAGTRKRSAYVPV
jgi:hypothetical protein